MNVTRRVEAGRSCHEAVRDPARAEGAPSRPGPLARRRSGVRRTSLPSAGAQNERREHRDRQQRQASHRYLLSRDCSHDLRGRTGRRQLAQTAMSLSARAARATADRRRRRRSGRRGAWPARRSPAPLRHGSRRPAATPSSPVAVRDGGRADARAAPVRGGEPRASRERPGALAARGLTSLGSGPETTSETRCEKGG